MARFDDAQIEEMFINSLDDGVEPIIVAGLTFYPSDILKKCDPVGYHVFLSDYEAFMNEPEEEEEG